MERALKGQRRGLRAARIAGKAVVALAGLIAWCIAGGWLKPDPGTGRRPGTGPAPIIALPGWASSRAGPTFTDAPAVRPLGRAALPTRVQHVAGRARL
jgi:hypothetical protein